MRFRIAILAVAAPIVLWGVLPLASSGQSGRSAQIEKKIVKTQRKIERKKKTEQVLTTTIQGYSDRINSIQDDIGRLQQRQDVIQTDLDAKKAELARLQEELRKQRARLAKLKARLAVSRAILADRLRATYEADKPDIVTVILSAKGFADLVERGEFLNRVNTQDRDILLRVKADKARTTRVAKRLDKLENHQQKVTTAILVRRNQVAEVKGKLVDKQDGWAAVRSDKSAALDTVRTERKQLDGNLADLRAEQEKISGVLNSGGGSGSAGPAKQGSGSMVWPVDGPITSPFCEARSWESCHPGIDIGLPSGTPIHAADSGTIAIAGWTGGYGNYTCIQHSSSLSSCYGHQSQINVSVGQNVSKGEVIGLVGSTGHSTGPHLHWEVRVNGSVVNPMNYV